MPDLTSSFHELNRFFDIGAYNPNGREPVTGNPVQDRKRDEGYLFWLGWTGHLTTSMFQTSDANGPIRRALAGLDCNSVRALVAQTPLSEPLAGLTNVLSDPALCGNGNTAPPTGLPIPSKTLGEGPHG